MILCTSICPRCPCAGMSGVEKPFSHSRNARARAARQRSSRGGSGAKSQLLEGTGRVLLLILSAKSAFGKAPPHISRTHPPASISHTRRKLRSVELLCRSSTSATRSCFWDGKKVRRITRLFCQSHGATFILNMAREAFFPDSGRAARYLG